MKHVVVNYSKFISNIIKERRFKNIPDWVYENIGIDCFSEIMGAVTDVIGTNFDNLSNIGKNDYDVPEEFLSCIEFIKTLRKKNVVSTKEAIRIIAKDIFDFSCDNKYMVLAYYLHTESDWRTFYRYCMSSKRIPMSFISKVMDLIVESYGISKKIHKSSIKLLLDSIDQMAVENDNDGSCLEIFIFGLLGDRSYFSPIPRETIQNAFFDAVFSYSDNYYWFDDVFSLDKIWKWGIPYYPKTKDCIIVSTYIEYFVEHNSFIELSDSCLDDLYSVVFEPDFYWSYVYAIKDSLIRLSKNNINNIRFLTRFLEALSQSEYKYTIYPNECIEQELVKEFCSIIADYSENFLKDYRHLINVIPGKEKVYDNDTIQRRFIEKGGNPLTLSGSSYIHTKDGAMKVMEYSSFNDIEGLIENDEKFLDVFVGIVGTVPYFPIIAKLSSHIELHTDIPIVKDFLIDAINQSYNMIDLFQNHKDGYHIASLSALEVSLILKNCPDAASHIPFHLQSYDKFISIARTTKSYVPIYFGPGNDDKGIEQYLDYDQIITLLSINPAYICDIKNKDIALKLLKAEFLWNN